MATIEEQFDAAAARVVAAYAQRGADRLAYERAWTAFYEGHLRRVMTEARLFANARGLGYESDDVRMELAIGVLDVLARGAQLNRRVVYGILRNVLGQVSADVAKLGDDSVRERFVERLRDVADTDAADTAGMRAELERYVASLGSGKRNQLKVQVLRAMLDDGIDNLAEIARRLDRSEGGIRSTHHYLLRDIRERHPDLAQFLELPEPVRDSDLLDIVPRRATEGAH